jgi:hypothetical protein
VNILSRDKQIEIIAALCEGMGIRATARNTGVNREKKAELGSLSSLETTTANAQGQGDPS